MQRIDLTSPQGVERSHCLSDTGDGQTPGLGREKMEACGYESKAQTVRRVDQIGRAHV